MPEHYAINANVLRGSITFKATKRGRGYFLDGEGRQVYFVTQPIVQLTLIDTTLAPAWRSKFLTDAQGRFTGIEVAFSAAQPLQVVEWVVSK